MLVALELELPAPLEVLLELEAAVVVDVSDSLPADVDATASPLVKLTASGVVSTREEGMVAVATPLTATGEVVVVAEYEDELAAVAALVPSPFACRAATGRLGNGYNDK